MIASDTFAEQRPARSHLSDDDVARLIDHLEARNGRDSLTAVAKVLGRPAERMPLLMRAVGKPLNVEGFEVLTLKDDDRSVHLNVRLPKEQFLEEVTRKLSRARRRRVIDVLGRGTVPQSDLDLFAVGMERFEKVLTDELAAVAAGGSGFKAVRGEYGSGKTFFARWLAEKAKRMKMAASEVQISDRITPLPPACTTGRSASRRPI